MRAKGALEGQDVAISRTIPAGDELEGTKYVFVGLAAFVLGVIVLLVVIGARIAERERERRRQGAPARTPATEEWITPLRPAGKGAAPWERGVNEYRVGETGRQTWI